MLETGSFERPGCPFSWINCNSSTNQCYQLHNDCTPAEKVRKWKQLDSSIYDYYNHDVIMVVRSFFFHFCFRFVLFFRYLFHSHLSKFISLVSKKKIILKRFSKTNTFQHRNGGAESTMNTQVNV